MTAAKLKELEAKATEGPWLGYWRKTDGDADCGIFSEVRKGHAYSVCRAPRYQTKEKWEHDYQLIVYLRNHAQDFIKLIDAAERHCVKRMLDDDHELRQALAAFKEKSCS